MPDDKTYSAQHVRQGRIVLNTPTRRWVFLGSLAAFVVLTVLGALIL